MSKNKIDNSKLSNIVLGYEELYFESLNNLEETHEEAYPFNIFLEKEIEGLEMDVEWSDQTGEGFPQYLIDSRKETIKYLQYFVDNYEALALKYRRPKVAS